MQKSVAPYPLSPRNFAFVPVAWRGVEATLVASFGSLGDFCALLDRFENGQGGSNRRFGGIRTPSLTETRITRERKRS